jgi:hypothetical protein
LNIDSGTQAASTFVPYLYREFCIQVEIPVFKGEEEETHRLVLKTSQTEDLKLCSHTRKLQVQHQFTIKHLWLSSSRAHTVSRRPDPTKEVDHTIQTNFELLVNVPNRNPCYCI